MYILAIQLGHNATVGLWADGLFLEVVSQEKFDNIKNSRNFPKEAIEYLLDKYNLNPKDIKYILNCGLTIWPEMLFNDLEEGMQNRGEVSIYQFLKELLGYLEYKFPLKIMSYLLERKIKKQAKIAPFILKEKLKRMGFIDFQLHMIEHHECHAYSPIALYGDTDEEFLIFTLDGCGDLTCSSVSIYSHGKIKKIAETPLHNSLGYIYSQTTRFLGMKPLEHEYKVMGLAAYAKADYFMKTYEKIFKGVMWLKDEGLIFDSKFPTRRFFEHLKKYAIGERFDNIAGALQYFTEELIIEWIRKTIKRTGIRKIMTSGGVFMNVKLNQKIYNLPEVEKVFFMPSCGDESNVFGAIAYFVKNFLNQKLNQCLSIYLGMEYTNEEVESFLRKKNLFDKYKIEYYHNIEKKIAELLANFNVVGRFAGRAEFGARSLGNRAILANPSDMKSFYMVNDQIKARDFWMPFAPSILDTYAYRYLKNYNPQKNIPYYMILTYDSTEEFQIYGRAAMHQGDRTVRPQIVTPEINNKYYNLLVEFEKLTGIGAILNTSLNIHGYPLAGTLEQALFTFENSGLEYIALENYLISKDIKR